MRSDSIRRYIASKDINADKHDLGGIRTFTTILQTVYHCERRNWSLCMLSWETNVTKHRVSLQPFRCKILAE